MDAQTDAHIVRINIRYIIHNLRVELLLQCGAYKGHRTSLRAHQNRPWTVVKCLNSLN